MTKLEPEGDTPAVVASEGSMPPRWARSAWGIAAVQTSAGTALSLTAIITAAIEVADEIGLAETSIRRIASRLSVSPMALYRHIDSRDDLIILMVDHAMGAPPPEQDEAAPWQDRLRAWAEALFARYTAHRWIIDAPVGDLPTTPNYSLWLERILQLLNRTGLELRTTLEASLLVDIHLRGTAQLIGNIRPSPDDVAPPALWVKDLITPERFPMVARVLAEGILDDDSEISMQFGLERIITGLEAIVPSS